MMLFRRFKRLLLVMKVFARFLLHGKANKLSKKLDKVLVVQTSKLGDMVCTTPVFQAIKEKYPYARVYVLGNPVNQELLEGLEFIDEYIPFTSNDAELIKIIRDKHFDAGLLVTPNAKILASLYLAGIPLIIAPQVQNGYSPYETLSYKIMSRFIIRMPHVMGNYAPREYLRLLEPLGIFSTDTKKYLDYSTNAKIFIEDFMKKESMRGASDFIIVISPSAGNRVKLWPAERFAQVADYLYAQYHATILIIGSAGDRDIVSSMLWSLDQKTKVIDTTGRLTLDQLKALIAKSNMLIAVDSGPIYIAEAFEVPTIDIIGPINELEQPPISNTHRIVKWDGRKHPELFVMNARVYDEAEARKQIESISVENVVRVFDDLYSFLDVKKSTAQ